MPRVKCFIDTDVYVEAKKRIKHVIESFDTIVICFSGGKDSLAVIHLVKEVYDEMGITRKLNVIFRDEELIHREVLEFVNKYRQLDWIDLKWFCLPLASKKFVMGVITDYVQWDNKRDWIRPKPEYAISLPRDDKRIFDQYNTDAFIAKYYKGKIALVNGIRASESLIRFRASVNKLTENYINTVPSTKAKNVKLVKPIFDWMENDIFKYFHEKNIQYCHIYDHQMWSSQSLRVSTPIHAESAKQFDKLRLTCPVLYEQVIQVFPDMTIQERYYRELDKKALRTEHSKSLKSIKDWIVANITDPHEFNLAKKRFNSVYPRYKRDPSPEKLEHIFTQFMNGSYKREIML